MASVNDQNNPLGKSSEYVDQYDASLLFPIRRDEGWKAVGVNRTDIPFHGEDIWNGYEISWLDQKGKPQVALGEFRIAANSTNIVESKSFKLYLNSYNQTRFDSIEKVIATMEKDLSLAADGRVEVILHPMDYQYPAVQSAECIDDLDVEVESYELDQNILQVSGSKVEKTLVSHLLKSNCPVTGQPDWGSIFVEYKGAEIEPASLLKYIVSLRQHQDFHEQCVERTFYDIYQLIKPESLTVYARYVRRGGLDINPFRTTDSDARAVNFRLPRQ